MLFNISPYIKYHRAYFLRLRGFNYVLLFGDRRLSASEFSNTLKLLPRT
jgi:hypothetical protein